MTTPTTTRRRTRSNGEGSTWKELHNGRERWKGRVTVGFETVPGPNGRLVRRQVRKTVTGPTKAVVLQRMREATRASEQGIDPAPRELTVARYLEDWITKDLPGTVAVGTHRLYSDIVKNYIVPTIGQRRLRALTPDDVQVMLRWLQTEYVRRDGAKGVSAQTAHSVRSVLRRALRRAEQKGLLERNVAQIANGVRIPHREGRTMTPDQARQFIDGIQGHRLEAAFTVALAIGLRKGELLGLEWSDVDLEAARPTLRVRQSLNRYKGQGITVDAPKTATSRRKVYLPRFASDALKAHRRRQIEERLAAGSEWVAMPLGRDFVFRTPIGTAVDPANFLHLTHRLTSEAGIGKWTPHELRHSCASLLIAKQVPLKEISDLLGHSSIRMTSDTYGHLLEPARIAVADAMESILG